MGTRISANNLTYKNTMKNLLVLFAHRSFSSRMFQEKQIICYLRAVIYYLKTVLV